MDNSYLKSILEALLLSSQTPLSANRLAEAFEPWERPAVSEIKTALCALAEDYQNRPIELKSLATGWQFQTRKRYAPWVQRLQLEKPAKYSRALLETLAVIAYRQPVTRADIEEIRAVSLSSQIMKTLIEHQWIRIAGHRDVPGRPAVYVTTSKFLDHFNLENLAELPELTSLSDEKDVKSQSFENEQIIDA